MLSHHHTRSQFVPRLLLLLILCLSIFPSISPSKLSSFYSLISSLATKPKPAGVKIKRSSLFWEISPASPIDPILESVDLENRSESGKIPQFVTSPIAALEKKVESLTFFQSLLQSIAASKVREDLALVSSHWANTARSVVASKYGQVIHLTRKVHEAQILSLQRASTAQLLDDALSKAAAVHYSSLTRFKELEAASEAAKHGVELISKALSLAQHILSVREKWAQEERARAFRLSTEYLRKVLEDLKTTLEFAQRAHSVVVEMR